MNTAASMDPLQMAILTYIMCAVVSLIVAGIISTILFVIKKQKKVIFSIIKMRHKKTVAKEEAI